jgi:tRNA threonylcarbamoyladenosine biosynthesis protein TsaE
MPHQAIPAADDFPVQGLTTSPQATAALGEQAAERLRGGDVLLLWGPLGAGKTCFVQGLCRGLGVAEEVTSPSFTLANRYRGRLVAHHLDFFRIGPRDDLTDIGVEAVLEEVEGGHAVLIVEWPQPLLPYLSTRLELLILPGAALEERIWHLRGVPELPPQWSDLLVNSGSR